MDRAKSGIYLALKGAFGDHVLGAEGVDVDVFDVVAVLLVHVRVQLARGCVSSGRSSGRGSCRLCGEVLGVMAIEG